MPHTSRWVTDKRVLLLEFTGSIEREEVIKLNDELKDFLGQGETPIHLIFDSRNMETLDQSGFENRLFITGYAQRFSLGLDVGCGWQSDCEFSLGN